MSAELLQSKLEEDYKSLVAIIRRSHKEFENSEIQQEALNKSLNYIIDHKKDAHLFCDRYMYPASVHLLILFSFGENEALQWFKESAGESLDSCTKCMSLFHRGRVKLKETFVTERNVDLQSVQQFSDLILQWESERLQKRFEVYNGIHKESLIAESKAHIPQELIYGVAECLYAPSMLRLREPLKELFEEVFLSLITSNHPFIRKTTIISPGLLYLLFECSPSLKRCAFNLLEYLRQEGKALDTSKVLPEVLEEFEYHFIAIQDPKLFSSQKCEAFYRNILPLLRLYDGEALLSKFNEPVDLNATAKNKDFEVRSLLKLLQAHLMGYLKEPLPYILRFFAFALESLGDKYWSAVSPFTFQNVLETITGSPHYLKNFVYLEDIAEVRGELNPSARLNDLFSWIKPFLSTLDESKRQQASNRLAMYFIIQVESLNSIPLPVKAEMFKVACELTNAALSIPTTLYKPSFRTDLLLRSDARVVVTTKLIRFMDYGTSTAIFFPEHERLKNSEVSRAAIKVIATAMRFDVLNFAQTTYDSLNDSPVSTLKFSPELFRLVLKQNFSLQKELAFRLLCSMENVSSVIPLENSQKNDIIEFLGYLRQFFIRFSDIDSKNTKMILSDARSLKGYWACVFSSDTDVYQSAVDILYETFDAEGRLEGLHSLLENNIESCITAINENLTNLIFLRSYYPCPRGVLVLSDIVHALNNPVNGLFGYSSKFTDQIKAALGVFWNRCWSFLDLIYVETIKWASKHTDLIEFTRDTLDLSHLLLGCFLNIKESQGDYKKTFLEITNTFPHMLSWLRLNDNGLLASCVKLITSTIDLASDLNLDFDKRAIELIAKYGSRAKKFNSKLNPQQSLEIINRAKLFDKDLVESVIIESEQYRKSRQPETAAKISESTPALKDSSDDVTIISERPRPRTQLKITNFGSLSRVAPTAPSKKVMPKSALELAREQINAKKNRVIHPPGQLGFNQRKKLARTGNDSSSDDDDDESGQVHALFNLAPPKINTGIQLIENNLTKPKKKTQENSKREEEFSRLRLNVDLKPLYRKVLTWSYQRKSDYPEEDHKEPLEVADRFSSSDSYIATYEPLLLLECWQAIMAAKTRQSDTPLKVVIGSKSVVGDFFEVFCSITKTELQDKKLTDSDLVVLSICSDEEAKPTGKQVHNAPIACFGKIHEIKYVRGDRADLTVRINRTSVLNNAFTPMSTIYMLRVMQMTTIEREYSSLHGLRYYNLSKQILQAQPDKVSELPIDKVESIRKTYQVNESQARAISSCVDTEGFSLIQGPPGTGKTKTILGIIGYMISNFKSSNSISVPTTNSLGSVSTIPKTRKVLVCAPSNAAVDELVLRLKDGIMDAKGIKYTPKLVRLGRTDAVNSAVKDMTLEELVDREVGKTSKPVNNMDALHKELAEVKNKIKICEVKLSDKNSENLEEVRQERRELKIKSNGIKKNMDEERERQNSAYRVREITRRNIQAKILDNSEIICSTLSGSAHDMVANMGIKFDSVIIDEACQCTELSAIIPLRYGCNRCIMVGDPNQLPPTVISSVAADHLYDQSLFVRMAKNVKPLLLNVQYRMNSAISKFPSKMFYDNELKDGPENDVLTVRPWHKDPVLKPYQFFDIVEGQQIQNSKTFSYTNKVEIDIAIELIIKLFNDFPKLDFRNKIGIITPYKEQNRALQRTFTQRFGESIKAEISFNTVDGFQGQEKEIIIMSCVRADPKGNSVGFLRDFRRMNVALTRPKCSLWILGNQNSLIKDSLWSDLITDAKERNLFQETRRGFARGSIPNTITNSNSTQSQHKQPKSNHSNPKKAHKDRNPASAEANIKSSDLIPLSKPSDSGYLPKKIIENFSDGNHRPYSNNQQYNAPSPAPQSNVNNKALNLAEVPFDRMNPNAQINNRTPVENPSDQNSYSGSNSASPVTGHQIPVIASRSGTLPPLPPVPKASKKKKRAQGPQSIFINNKRRHKG